MQIMYEESWEVETSGTKNIRLVNNNTGDRAVSVLYVNPLEDTEITVKGFVDDSDSNGVELVSVDIANLEKASDGISTAGNYMFIVEPYYKVSVAVDGTATVNLKTLA